MHIQQLLSPRHFAKEEFLLNRVLRYVLTVHIVSGQYRGEIVVCGLDSQREIGNSVVSEKTDVSM